MIQYMQQLQEQHQEASAPAPAPTASPAAAAPQNSDAITNAAIASFLAEESGSAGADDASDAANSPALAQVADDAEVPDHPDARAGAEPAKEAEAEPAEPDQAEAKPAAFDGAKLVAAIEKRDLSALLEAMGPAAEEMLTSKAHVTLRLQERDAKKATAKAEAQERKATELATKLDKQYGDPVALRKACIEGTPDAADRAVAAIERWAGTDWNTFVQWLGKSVVGKPTPMPQKQAEPAPAKPAVDPIAQAKAMDETKAWISTELRKADASLVTEYPEAVELVLEEIRGAVARGETTVSPAKSLPAVLAKLKERHDKLAKYFAGKAKAKPAAAATPVAKVGKSEGKATREQTLEELIAETILEAGGQKAGR